MTKYRKKPIVIEAWPVWDIVKAVAQAWSDLPKPIAEAYEKGDVLFLPGQQPIQIKTLEGWMTANVEDMVIRGVKGELYPCQSEIFEMTYEEVLE